MTFQTEWAFDTEGKLLPNYEDYTDREVAIRVHVMTHTQALAIAETLQPQVEALYARHIATISDPPVTAASIVKKIFTPKPKDESADEERTKSLEARSLVFLAYWVTGGERVTDLAGFAQVYDELLFDVVAVSAFTVDPSLSEQQQQALQTALFHASESAGKALALALLAEKRAKAELESDGVAESKPLPTSQAFWRRTFMASDFAKKLFADHGFVNESYRLEMSKDLEHVDESDPVFPEDVEIKALDLSDYTEVQHFYEIIKQAFGSAPPSFEAWKIHYAQQPRFAPELSFVARNKTDGAVIAAIGIERIVESEGGGDDEVKRVFTTSVKLHAHNERASSANSASSTAGAELSEVNDALQQLLDATSATALVFPSNFDARKEAVVQRATVGYVCGVATNPEWRGKGLASGLLRRAFRVAASETSLREIILGTDALNKSAVRAYQRAGMVETKRVSSGRIVVKHISLQP